MRYFDTSARHHHDDEEHDLFPALIESMAGSDAICLRELTAALTAEHRELEARWQTLRVAIAQVAAGQMVLLAQADLSSVAQLYAGYIAREESELLPMAHRRLRDAELDWIGFAMRKRRGVSSDQVSPSAKATDPSIGTSWPIPISTVVQQHIDAEMPAIRRRVACA